MGTNSEVACRMRDPGIHSLAMSIRSFAEGVAQLATRSPLFEGKSLRVRMIANPKAGGFTRPRVHERHLRELKELLSESATLPTRVSPTYFDLQLTEKRRHACEMTRELIDAAGKDPEKAENLIITAGGDGTSLEVLTELLLAPEEIRERFVILRLPMGTGNDGSDGRELPDSLGRLIRPAKFAKQSALVVTTATGRGPWHAFNITSMGVDAFVAHSTNLLKVMLPGDSYKFFLDLASVFYTILYKVEDMEIDFFDAKGTKTGEAKRKLLLLAMGASGHRTYGSNKLILPGDENVCMIDEMPFRRKLILKEKIPAGHHKDFPEARLLTADKAVIRYGERIIIQMDGEAEKLAPEDFPVVLERTAPLLRIIRYVDR
jgi:diacylglycerol kinase family enzyme